jgi:CDP-diacylglycerol--glycerol-3-phosphate 3-phosphatidyltransferase
MRRHIPNLLTASRFLLAIAFFAVLSFFDSRGAEAAGWPVLDVAFIMFLVAVATDMVDGYLARRLGHLTTFGRIADPFVDKIIICGALAFFIGDQFLRINVGPGGAVASTENLTGWQPWMVALVLARELLVTGMRGFSESHGISFAATASGKVKMIIQSAAVAWCIFYVGHWTAGPDWTRIVRDVLVWATVLFTAASGLVYVKRAYVLLRMPPD